MWMLDALWTLFLGLAVTVGPFIVGSIAWGLYKRAKAKDQDVTTVRFQRRI